MSLKRIAALAGLELACTGALVIGWGHVAFVLCVTIIALILAITGDIK